DRLFPRVRPGGLDGLLRPEGCLSIRESSFVQFKERLADATAPFSLERSGKELSGRTALRPPGRRRCAGYGEWRRLYFLSSPFRQSGVDAIQGVGFKRAWMFRI